MLGLELLVVIFIFTDMRHFLLIFSVVGIVSIYGCYDNDHSSNLSTSGAYTKTIYKSYSPDNTKLLTLKEYITKGESGYTQVFIEFKNSGSGVYAVDTIGVDIKTYWVDNNQIVIETKRNYEGHQKWNQVQSFNDIVKVRYIER